MKRLKKILIILAVLIVILAGAGYVFFKTQMTHHTVSGTPEPIVSSGDRILDAIRKGAEFLRVHQEPDGEFSAGLLDPKPAFTAMVVDALVSSPDHLDEKTPYVAKAVQAIIAHQQGDGGIYTPRLGLGNYCTSVSIMALGKLNNPAYDTVIERGRDFITKIQQKDGGLGYMADSESDLSNTAMALEALHQSGLPKDSEAFKKAVTFITRCQNSSESNPEAWAGNDGGFIYRPANSKAGTRIGPDGKTEYISYGLMSYAGLVSFLWAGVDKSDERVKSAFHWVRSNWTLDENRNLKDAGLYYYYLTMAKAMKAYGDRMIQSADGKMHDWPAELSERIISLQQEDGSWVNENKAWFEKDPILVSAYMIKALSICHEAMQ